MAANKGIVNRAIELMGRGLLQQLAAENDAVAHRAPAVQEFNRLTDEQGFKAALEWRTAPSATTAARSDWPLPIIQKG